MFEIEATSFYSVFGDFTKMYRTRDHSTYFIKAMTVIMRNEHVSFKITQDLNEQYVCVVSTTLAIKS